MATESRLWQQVNAIGGVPANDYERGFSEAIGQALTLIEASGHDELLAAVRYADTRAVSRAAYPLACIEDRKLRDLIDAALTQAAVETPSRQREVA